jgi:hypothetical protein
MAELIPPVSRREGYAEATRQAIVAAARDLFGQPAGQEMARAPERSVRMPRRDSSGSWFRP